MGLFLRPAYAKQDLDYHDIQQDFGFAGRFARPFNSQTKSYAQVMQFVRKKM